MLYEDRDPRRHLPAGRRFAVVLGALSLALICVANPASALKFEPYVVHGVKVDVTDKTAAAARQVALAQGEAKAFRVLLERLTLRADYARLPDVDEKDVPTFVQDFSVEHEKTSSVRYIASLSYRFQPERVRALLRDHDIDFAETPSKPVLVLPIIRAAAALALWDDPNPWRDSWTKPVDSSQLVPFVLPDGDLQDIAAIGPDQALDGDLVSLNRIAQRYKTGDTLVALAELRAGPRAAPVVEVSATRYGARRQQDQTLIASFEAQPGETVQDLLNRAAGEIAARVEDQWKADNILQFGRAGVLLATLPISSLADWVEVKKKLASVAVIRRTNMLRMSRGEVRVNLQFIGDVRQLKLALSQVDLILIDQGNSWILARDEPDRARGPEDARER